MRRKKWRDGKKEEDKNNRLSLIRKSEHTAKAKKKKNNKKSKHVDPLLNFQLQAGSEARSDSLSCKDVIKGSYSIKYIYNLSWLQL